MALTAAATLLMKMARWDWSERLRMPHVHAHAKWALEILSVIVTGPHGEL